MTLVTVTFFPALSDVDAAQLVADLACHTPDGFAQADSLPTPLVTVTHTDPDRDIPATSTVAVHVGAGADVVRRSCGAYAGPARGGLR